MKKETKPSAAALRQKAEALLNTHKDKACLVSAGSDLASNVLGEPDTLKLIHELAVHQIELELQNEELLLAKQQAELATEKYTSLYDFSPSGYFTLSADGEIMELNLTGARMLGRERSRLVNRSFGIFISGESKPAFNHFLAEAFNTNASATCEVALRANGGITAVVILTGARDESGKRLLVSAVDITGRKQAGEALRQSEELFKAIFENSLNPIMIADDAGNYLKVNQAAVSMFHYPVERMLQMNVGDIQTIGSPDAASRYQEYLAKGFEIGEFHFVRPDKSEAIAQYHAVRVRENFNLSILSDITERKRAEEALRESEGRFRSYIEYAPDGVFISDEKGNYLEVNSAACKITGYSEDELLKLSNIN